jgi:hypothetical protein
MRAPGGIVFEVLSPLADPCAKVPRVLSPAREETGWRAIGTAHIRAVSMQAIRAIRPLYAVGSRRNLFYVRRFAALWPELEKVQPLSAQIGWTHLQC